MHIIGRLSAFTIYSFHRITLVSFAWTGNAFGGLYRTANPNPKPKPNPSLFVRQPDSPIQ